MYMIWEGSKYCTTSNSIIFESDIISLLVLPDLLPITNRIFFPFIIIFPPLFLLNSGRKYSKIDVNGKFLIAL